MMSNDPTREADDKLLRLLELRTEGITSKAIGYRFGMTGGGVRAATNKIVIADAKLHDDMISFEEPNT